MKLNFKALGGGFLTAGQLLIQFGGAQAAWWLGVTMSALGPVLLAIQTPEPKSKPRRTRRKKATP